MNAAIPHVPRCHLQPKNFTWTGEPAAINSCSLSMKKAGTPYFSSARIRLTSRKYAKLSLVILTCVNPTSKHRAWMPPKYKALPPNSQSCPLPCVCTRVAAFQSTPQHQSVQVKAGGKHSTSPGEPPQVSKGFPKGIQSLLNERLPPSSSLKSPAQEPHL
ncbi:hypothetical protein H8959_014612 [Pygathrix nigripes]